MLDEFNTSYLDLDASLLNAEPTHCDLSFSDNPTAQPPTLSTSCAEYTPPNSHKSHHTPPIGFYNPRYKPIIDDGREYRYEDDPALYRRIRK